ncbi:MAG: hypothetical protein ABIO94_02625, partial [Opitutaceae bacterium]
LPLAELMPAFEPVSSPSPKSSIPPINLGVDPEKQQITFKLTYSGTIIASFAVVVVIGLAYVIGRHGSGVSSANASVSTEQIKSGPVRKDVLNVSGAVGVSSLVASNTGADVEGYANHPAKPPARSTNDAGKADPATPAPAPASDGKAQRIIGMQYVIMQSYPDQPDADEAVALLKQNGIEASVEKLPWYSKWPTVVGATGFDRLKNNPQYDRYIESIEKVSAKFAGRSKFKRFTPQAVRWK